MVEMSKRVKPWREAVVWAAREAGAKINGPVVAEIVFTWPKPKSAPKKRRTWPDRTPDLDKLLRSTFDGLTTSGVIEDDARIVHVTASKVFPNEAADALDVPGAVIRLREVRD
jgi:Holliday junction resolvase RusA-like endonuclease